VPHAMSSLADRLKQKGFQLPDEAPPVPLHSKIHSKVTAVGAHRELTISSRERVQLFTPLETRGSKAIKVEEKINKDCEQDLLKGVRKTLINWVQMCLANPDKRQQLHEKGLLKCRVQAQWSKDLNSDLHAFVEGFGGRIAANCEKENSASTRPAWENYAARDEKWIVGFDVAAFENFMKAHPRVLGPSDCKLRQFIEDHSRKVNVDNSTLRVLYEALEAQYGPLAESLKTRAKHIAAEAVNSLSEERKSGSKRRDANDAGGPSKRGRVGLCSAEDAAWAAEVLAPLGMTPGSNVLAAKPPVDVMTPIMAGLRHLEPSAELLKSTNLGIIVANYRQHPSPEIAGAAKELVAAWKAACLAKKNVSS